MKRKVDPRERGARERKRLNRWIKSIVSSNRKKVVKKVHMKKYLEAMETPQLDHLFSSAKHVENVQYIMCVLRGRIFRNTFPHNIKGYIARVYNGILVKAKTDLRDIDPTDQLMMIHLTTNNHDLFFSTGDGYMMAIQQKHAVPEQLCQDKPDVLCLTQEERNKIIELLKERSRTKRIIKDRRMEEYDIYLNRKALDDAWMKYMKKAYVEAESDLLTCTKGDEDVFNLEVTTEDDTKRTGELSSQQQLSKRQFKKKPMGKMTESELKALIMQKSDKGMLSKEKLQISFETAMDKRLERLVKMVEDKREVEDTAYMHKKLVKIQDILRKEKMVREHMIKDLPNEEDF